ncbi:TrmH family RNA methyltransferase [Streptomyces sp. JJ38]|uniref:TrmH family RNA methyltransferase n=1 Tax=Streptomyces sp. JJ38 TaxID=2738128 RepID=UPI0027E155AD|nr:TrmH family RNA methyltransferase [Streptomyces sp. JJ38]
MTRENTEAAERAVRAWRASVAGGAVLLDGFHAVKHALRFGADVGVVLARDAAAVRALAGELAPDVAEELAGRVVEVDGGVLRELVPRPHPTGVAALAVRRGREANLAALRARPRSAPVVLLEDPRNLGNVGAVVRLAAGLGATGVVTTGPADPWHPAAVRGGAGLHYATAVERVTPKELPPGPLYVLDPEGADLRGSVVPDDAVLAFGTERHGVSAELKARADHLLALPMRPNVSSYNLATSVAMTLYHWSCGPGKADRTPVSRVR